MIQAQNCLDQVPEGMIDHEERLVLDLRKP